MLYVMALGMSPYTNTIGRTSKPFNPILGETFELITQDYKFISEQVSHHPPVSAGYAFNSIFEYYGNTNVKSTFWGKSMEVTPQGSSHLILKQHNEHYTFTKCNTLIKNILVGQMYIDQEGVMTFKNHNTQDYAELQFTEQGWTGKGAFEMKGFVRNSKG